MISGKHLIAGEWVSGDETFLSRPSVGEALAYSVGNPDHVNKAAQAAEDAFWSYSALSREARAEFLDRIADEIDARGPAITKIGVSETGLPAARLEGERGRTAGQLRLFGVHIRKGAYLDLRHDAALPDRKPLPRPDMQLNSAPDRARGSVRCVKLPSSFLHCRRRHSLRFGRWLPGSYKGPLRSSRYRRGCGAGSRCGD